jgi:hypothetical protein
MREYRTTDDIWDEDLSGAKDNVQPLKNTKLAVDFILGRPGFERHELCAMTPDVEGLEGATFLPGERDRMAAWIDARQGKKNIYFAINECRADAPRDTKPSKEDIGWLHKIGLDLDEKDAPGATPEARKEALLAAFKHAIEKPENVKFKPTITLDTGGGYQPLWHHGRVECTKENLERDEGIGRRLQERFGGDHIADASRILRLPGTINLPDAKKRARGRTPVVSGIADKTKTKYSIEALAEWAPPLEQTPKTSSSDPKTKAAIEQLKANEQEIDSIGGYEDLPDALKVKLAHWCEQATAFENLCNGEPAPGQTDESRSGYAWALGQACNRAKHPSKDDPLDFTLVEFAQMIRALPGQNPEYDWRNVALAWLRGQENSRRGDYRRTKTAEWFEATGEQPDGLGVMNAGLDFELPPPRGWLLGNQFARKFLSSLIADGGVGKTALRYAQLLSLATERSLIGERVFQRCRVLIVSLEDDIEELRRRIWAARLHHKIEADDIKGWLFMCAPGGKAGKLLTVDDRGKPAIGALAANIQAAIKKHQIDLVSLDPFVKTHSVEENSNSLIDDVVQVLTDLAAEHNIAVDAPHHTSKGIAEPGNANRGRGASAMKDGGRLVYTLTPMSPDEAKAFDVPEEDRRSYIRLDSGKVNITKSGGAAKWFRLVSVTLGNATKLYPNGDSVQTVEPWVPPQAWSGLTADKLNEVLDKIDTGLPNGDRYSDVPSAKTRAAWQVVAEVTSKTEAQCREIIKTWVKNGVLEAYSYESPTARRTMQGLKVNHDERPK